MSHPPLRPNLRDFKSLVPSLNWWRLCAATVLASLGLIAFVVVCWLFLAYDQVATLEKVLIAAGSIGTGAAGILGYQQWKK
jgi:hypothetical protein